MSMNRFYILIILLTFLQTRLAAQQEPLYTQFMFNKILYNPGFAGTQSPTLTAVYRNQWMGLDGAPKTQALSYSQPMLKDRSGLGIGLVRNTIGITRTVSFEVAYAYRMNVLNGTLGAGLSVNMRHLFQDWSDERLVTTQPNDIALPVDPRSKLVPNFGFGVYYTTTTWYAGLAAPRLVNNNIDFADQGSILSREAQHINLMCGVDFTPDDDIKITPQLLLKYVPNAPFDADINTSILVKQKFYGGATYRTGGDTNGAGESISLLFGMRPTENLFFCLSYDIGLTRLRRYHNGSVEAIVMWDFNPRAEGKTLRGDRPWEQ